MADDSRGSQPAPADPLRADELAELRGLVHDALQTVAEAATELRQASPGDLGADELDEARRKLIRARAIAEHCAAQPSGFSSGDSLSGQQNAGETLAPQPVHAAVKGARPFREWTPADAGVRCGPVDEHRSAPAEPGYPRIAEAIGNALEAADLRVDVSRSGGYVDDELTVLATVLDRAGLIDWRAFSEEDTDA